MIYCDIKKLILIYFILVLTICVGCNSKHISMTFENVIFSIDKNIHEDDFVFFCVKVNNPTSKDIIVDSEGNEKSSEISGFYLVTNQLYSGAIKLKLPGLPTEKKIESRKSRKLILVLLKNKLQSLLSYANNATYNYDNIKYFIKQSDFKLVYISNKYPETMNVLKSKSFKTIEYTLNSQDTINKILMP